MGEGEEEVVGGGAEGRGVVVWEKEGGAMMNWLGFCVWKGGNVCACWPSCCGKKVVVEDWEGKVVGAPKEEDIGC